MSIVIDLNLACVVCLQQDDIQLHSMFERHDQGPPLLEKIACCSELRIDPENNRLPDKICQQCLDDLDAAWRFRQNCAAANTVFQSILKQDAHPVKISKYDLEQENIKVPSGLTIKRIDAQPKSRSTQMQRRNKRTAVATSEAGYMEIELNQEELEEQNDDNSAIEMRMIYDNSAEIDQDEEEEEDEGMESVEYYETEQVLDDGDQLDGPVESVKTIERFETKSSGIPKKSTTKYVFEDQEIKEENEDYSDSNEVYIADELEDDDEDYVPNNQRKRLLNMKRENVNGNADERAIPKRGRGRPRKNQIDHSQGASMKSNLKHAPTRFKYETMSPRKSLLKKLTSEVNMKSHPSDKEQTNMIYKVPTRNRKKLSPGARPPKICEICGNSYKYQHALNAHMRRHTNTKPFSCEFCDKAFVSNVELGRHIRVHTGYKPYPCQYCDRRFSDFGSRIKHERTHTGERPYVCSCGKSFAYAHVLSVHMRTHTGEKKFPCTLCNKGFTKKAYLETHLDQHAQFGDSMETDGGSRQNLSKGEMIAIKTVALEECIFTTEYIDEKDEELERKYEITEILEADDVNEDHLDDENSHTEYIIGLR